ncbi:peptidoglycan-binding domain-containing protein [uncultured Tateyamaria sp.]|uniref:peptidoglycan-binding domain-containing protein n=1 Tax=uncultured Tateyamaria sp. TaxID=455651 RepID=UPI00260615D7|nr:peptidoglycan-binding domain-containing protein [uncultured Tateyamaria sp.]
MRSISLIPALAAALLVTACAENAVVTSSNIDPVSLATSPPGAAPGTCWGKTVSPAVVETVTRKVLLQPAQISSDGRVQAAPIYKDETHQEVVRPRRDTWYEVPCAADLTPEFVSSLQRALAARGYYRGAVTGEIDNATQAAVQRYQRDEGLDSKTLSVAAARKLGLIAVVQPAAG